MFGVHWMEPFFQIFGSIELLGSVSRKPVLDNNLIDTKYYVEGY